MKKVEIYTDGACSNNPGPGGWGAVLIFKGLRKEISGFAPSTTNNRMEITAALEALGLLKEPCDVDLFSDSRYLVDAIEKGWALNWRRNNWQKPDKTPALNVDLWEQMLALLKTHKVKFIWVKGHASNELNNRCDELARAAIKENVK